MIPAPLFYHLTHLRQFSSGTHYNASLVNEKLLYFENQFFNLFVYLLT